MNSGYHAFITVQQCRLCGRIQNSIMTEAPESFPVRDAECASCGGMAAAQMGPPVHGISA